MDGAFLGIDVGTTSARAGLFDGRGRLLGEGSHALELWLEPGGIAEMSSAAIWNAVTAAARQAVAAAGLPPEAVKGIGFDATCSMAVIGPDGEGIPVGPSGDPARDVIVWMDHRATEEARFINAGGHEVLRYVGGRISPEMQTPKLLWLKRHMPESFHRAAHFLDLSDFLTWKATGSTARSTCTVTCKWTYLAHGQGWQPDYFDSIGLEELPVENFRRIGAHTISPGEPQGRGLTQEAAAAFGFLPGTPVAASLIDAHAGGIGTVGAGGGDLGQRLGYIMGTSACIMATTPEPCFVPGVWGPYFSAMAPGLWLNEGGQSAAGIAMDHLVRSHPAHGEAERAAGAEGLPLLDWLERRVLARVEDASQAALLARDLHIVPEYLGNRAPLADPDARAAMAGLDLDDGIEALERLHVAGLCGLAYGFADVADAMKAQGMPLRMAVISGGASRSPLVRRIMADASGLDIALPDTPQPVLLGAAMLGAVAAGAHASIPDAMAAMSRLGPVSAPASGIAPFHTAKRRIYTAMQALDREARAIMADMERETACC